MFIDLVRSIYESTIRMYLPNKIGVYYTVPINDQKLFDINTYNPYRKKELLTAVENYSTPGDQILVFGGGRGLAAIVAARRVLPNGHVIVYEAAKEQCLRTKKSVDFNNLTEYVTINQSIIGSTIDVWGDMNKADITKPEKLPDSTVWVIDIEGGELGLLKECSNNNVNWPKAMIIESHPHKGANIENIEDLLYNLDVNINITVKEIGEETTGAGGSVIIADLKEE